MAFKFYSRAGQVYRRDDEAKQEARWDENLSAWVDSAGVIGRSLMFDTSDTATEIPEPIFRLTYPEAYETETMVEPEAEPSRLSDSQRHLVEISAVMGESFDALMKRVPFHKALIPSARAFHDRVTNDLKDLPPGQAPDLSDWD